jgi:hypothetical protein
MYLLSTVRPPSVTVRRVRQPLSASASAPHDKHLTSVFSFMSVLESKRRAAPQAEFPAAVSAGPDTSDAAWLSQGNEPQMNTDGRGLRRKMDYSPCFHGIQSQRLPVPVFGIVSFFHLRESESICGSFLSRPPGRFRRFG